MSNDEPQADENVDNEPIYETLMLLQLFRPDVDRSEKSDTNLNMPESKCILPSRILEVMSGVSWTAEERKHVLSCEGCVRRVRNAVETFSSSSEEAARIIRDLNPEQSETAELKPMIVEATKAQPPHRLYWLMGVAIAASILLILGFYFNSIFSIDDSSGSQVLAQLLSAEQLQGYTPPASRSDRAILLRRGNSYQLKLAHPSPLQRQWLVRLTRSKVDVVALAKADESIEYTFDTESDWGDEDNRVEIFVLVTSNDVPKGWDDPDVLPISLNSETSAKELFEVEDIEEKNKRLSGYATQLLNSVFGPGNYRALVVWCESENRL